MLRIEVRKFQELTLDELYSVLQLRSEVFCVEQNCVYQDLDDKDQKAHHLLGIKSDQLVAYTRIFAPGDYFDDASIGRVLVKESERTHGYGQDIMKTSINFVNQVFNTTSIRLSAQSYLIKFYGSLGFETIGAEYLEDGIPHIAMVKK